MYLRVTTLIFLLLISFRGIAIDNSFYDDRERGWFWHETYPEPEPEIEPEKIKEDVQIIVIDEAPSEPEKKAPIKLTTKWLKANFPKIVEMAMDDPIRIILVPLNFILQGLSDKNQK